MGEVKQTSSPLPPPSKLPRGIRLPMLFGQGLCGTSRGCRKGPSSRRCKHIYLAGRPGEQEAALRDAGVSDFIFAGCDALAMLQQAWQRMERT